MEIIMNIPREHAEKWKNVEIIFHPIGVIHSEHTEHDNTPIQGIFNPSVGYIEVFEENAAGLLDIESFSHIYVLYYFHRATGKNLVQKPFLDGEKERGILQYAISIGPILSACQSWTCWKLMETS